MGLMFFYFYVLLAHRFDIEPFGWSIPKWIALLCVLTALSELLEIYGAVEYKNSNGGVWWIFIVWIFNTLLWRFLIEPQYQERKSEY